MAIELSNLTFTEQDDIVPAFGVEQILNTGIANTLAGNDRITGTGVDYGFKNVGTLNTDDGNDTITGTTPDGIGISLSNVSSLHTEKGSDVIIGTGLYGIENSSSTFTTGDGNDTITGIGRVRNSPEAYSGYGIVNSGTLNAAEGNDIITGTAKSYGFAGRFGYAYSYGILNSGTLNAAEGNDTITGTGEHDGIVNSGTLNAGEGNDIITGGGNNGLNNSGTLNTGEGDDIIDTNGANSGLNNYGGTLDTGKGNDTITATTTSVYYQSAMYNSGSIDTSDGNDIIAGIGRSIGILNVGIINSGNGEDSITSQGNLINRGEVFLGGGNDLISVDRKIPPYYDVVENFGFIGTGDGSDTITSTGILYNEGVIETGNGDDSIIVDIDTDIRYGIKNNGGAINMGDGNDSIIANEGFESGHNSSGAWFLGEGEDYIKGYGSGDFYGGNGNDTLELTPGTYTVGIWGDGGESPIFTKGDQLMITSEFEKLKAGSTIYDFTSLTAGQIITVA